MSAVEAKSSLSGKMKPEIKERWLKALRSGEYTQGRGSLRYTKREKQVDAFCCLGVLCDIAQKDGIGHWGGVYEGEQTFQTGSQKNGFSYGSETALTSSVLSWAGLEVAGSTVFIKRSDTTLAQLNDSGKSFKEIADIIEREL